MNISYYFILSEMRKLFFFAICIFLLQSCAISNLQKTEKEFVPNKILNDQASSYMYKAEIHIYDNYFSGLIVIKPKETGHRIVFMNEIGMKFFDFELSKESYIIHQIFEAMNKKIFIKLLVSDFKHILLYNVTGEFDYFTEKEEDSKILKPKKTKELYYFDKTFLSAQKSEKYSIFRKHTFINYSGYMQNIPGKINIEHKNIKFKMNLTYIKQK